MKVVVELSKEEMESYKNAMRLGLGNSAMRKIINGTLLPNGLIPINDAMSVFDENMSEFERRVVMLKYENECVGCPPNMGCLGGACPYRNVPVWVCDKCGEEAEELWNYEGEELCQECLLKTIPKAEESDHRDEEDDVYDRADYEYDRWRDEE